MASLRQPVGVTRTLDGAEAPVDSTDSLSERKLVLELTLELRMVVGWELASQIGGDTIPVD